MLDRVEITNFATIAYMSFDLGSSLNIITGETGSGKSVLVQAISTALGGRADISMIRNGSDKALIQVTGHIGDDDVIISRELLKSGKSVAKLNGEIVSLAKLRDFCKDFVDIHGQYDNQQILDPENHILITDSYRHETISGELIKLAELYRSYHEVRREYDKLLHSESESRRQQDFYQFEFDYIDKLDLTPGEDEELREQLDLMRNSERIYEAVVGSYSRLTEDPSVLSLLGSCMHQLQGVASYSEELGELSGNFTELYYNLEDLSSTLRTTGESINFSEEEIDSVSSRLSVLEDAKRKYNMSIEEIIKYKEELDNKLGVIHNLDSEKERVAELIDSRYRNLETQANVVSRLRRSNAEALEREMLRELNDLAFANSDFRIEITRLDEITELGYDGVEFLISTNPGDPLRPMSKIASGGEISRIMLAFKHIIGSNDSVETMIFDEIDTGISGKTALVVGHKLSEIAKHRQIVCITHLPQIAASGDDNFSIDKKISDGKSHTVIEHLNDNGKLEMLARLISGAPDSSNAIEAARELIAAVKTE